MRGCGAGATTLLSTPLVALLFAFQGDAGVVSQTKATLLAFQLVPKSRGPSAVLRTKGGGSGRDVSNRERWESAGFSLQPDFGPEAHPEVPLEHRLGDASEYGDTNAVQRLLQVGANVNAADWAGFTALHRAAFHGHLDTVMALIAGGAQPNIQEFCGGRTALHQAAGQGHEGIVQFLLEHGANPHIRDLPVNPQIDHVPGLREAINMYPPVIDGADEDKVFRSKGMTALDYAEDGGHAAVADLIRPWLADPDAVSYAPGAQ